jgi:flagellin-like hook-associated protein FlgL
MSGISGLTSMRSAASAYSTAESTALRAANRMGQSKPDLRADTTLALQHINARSSIAKRSGLDPMLNINRGRLQSLQDGLERARSLYGEMLDLHRRLLGEGKGQNHTVTFRHVYAEGAVGVDANGNMTTTSVFTTAGDQIAQSMNDVAWQLHSLTGLNMFSYGNGVNVTMGSFDNEAYARNTWMFDGENGYFSGHPNEAYGTSTPNAFYINTDGTSSGAIRVLLEGIGYGSGLSAPLGGTGNASSPESTSSIEPAINTLAWDGIDLSQTEYSTIAIDRLGAALNRMSYYQGYLGTVEKQIEWTQEWNQTLNDVTESGIAKLTSISMESEAAKLKAAEASKQLAMSGMAIANQFMQTRVQVLANVAQTRPR